MDLRFRWGELRQDASETQRVFAERRPDPIVAGGRRVAFVEDQIDDAQDRRQTGGAILSAGDLEGNVFLGERALRPDDPLRDRRLRHQKRARDLFGGQPTEQTKGERDARINRQDRMAGREHQPQQVVAHIIVQRRVEVGHGAAGFELVTELLVLTLEQLLPAEEIDRPVLGGSHEPGARIPRHAGSRPLFERRHERVLREVLRQADVADNADKRRDEPWGLDAPDGVDRAMSVFRRCHSPSAAPGRSGRGQKGDHTMSGSERQVGGSVTS